MSAAKQPTWVVDWNGGYGSPSIWAGSAPSGHGPSELIATVHGDNAHADDHARLIAAAPELLEAAKLVLEWYEAEDDHSKADFYERMQMCRDSEQAIRSAIAKAEGGAA